MPEEAPAHEGHIVIGDIRTLDAPPAIGAPTLRFVHYPGAQQLIRTLPALQHDKDKPEDLDTEGEDHLGDALRYGCMSRPWTQSKPKDKTKKVDTRQPTLNELYRSFTVTASGNSFSA